MNGFVTYTLPSRYVPWAQGRSGRDLRDIFASKWHVDTSVPASVDVISSILQLSDAERIYTGFLLLTKEYNRLQAPITQIQYV